MSDHPHHEMHEHSLDVYREEYAHLAKRARRIACYVADIGHPLTVRRIVEGLGFSDMNSCRPRVNELIDQGILEECGSAIDHVTGHRVMLVRIRTREPEQQRLF